MGDWIFLGIVVAVVAAVVMLVAQTSRRQRLHGGSRWAANRDRERFPKPGEFRTRGADARSRPPRGRGNR
jgi:MFS superfamily sulfate permease-like transporter